MGQNGASCSDLGLVPRLSQAPINPDYTAFRGRPGDKVYLSVGYACTLCNTGVHVLVVVMLVMVHMIVRIYWCGGIVSALIALLLHVPSLLLLMLL